MGRWDVGTMGHKTLKNNVMDVVSGFFECFCSFNKKVYPVPVSANLLIA